MTTIYFKGPFTDTIKKKVESWASENKAIHMPNQYVEQRYVIKGIILLSPDIIFEFIENAEKSEVTINGYLNTLLYRASIHGFVWAKGTAAVRSKAYTIWNNLMTHLGFLDFMMELKDHGITVKRKWEKD